MVCNRTRVHPTVEQKPATRTRTAGLPLPRLWALLVLVLGVVLTAMSVAFLWPNEGRREIVRAGKLANLERILSEEDLPVYVDEGNFFLVRHRPGAGDPYVESGVAKDGIMILSARSPHLPRDRVFYCASSGWFESFPDGSRFNPAGERMAGSPAPAGLWRHPFEVSEDGDVLVDIGTYSSQPFRGTDTLRQPPAGPHCAAPPATGRLA